MAKFTKEDIRRFHEEIKDIEVYEKYRDTFENFEVAGVLLRKPGDTNTSAEVKLHVDYGTGGSLSGAFSQTLAKHLTETIEKWFNYQINERRAHLAKSDVEV